MQLSKAGEESGNDISAIGYLNESAPQEGKMKEIMHEDLQPSSIGLDSSSTKEALPLDEVLVLFFVDRAGLLPPSSSAASSAAAMMSASPTSVAG